MIIFGVNTYNLKGCYTDLRACAIYLWCEYLQFERVLHPVVRAIYAMHVNTFNLKGCYTCNYYCGAPVATLIPEIEALYVVMALPDDAVMREPFLNTAPVTK